MRLAQFSAAFVAAILLFSGAALAQELNSYSVDANIISPGQTKVKMVLTFAEPEDRFELFLPIQISNFQATSTAGPVTCGNQLGATTQISCDLPLTAEKKTLEFTFEASDLVKSRNRGFVFAGDFSVKIPIKDVLMAVRLPEGMVLSQDIPGGSTVPFSNSTSTDGRKITIIWRLPDAKGPLNFQVFYEPGISADFLFENPPLRVLVLVALIVGGAIGLIFLKRRKETKQVVLSVLDDYERRVVSAIEKAGGTINQKRIVQDTNLSKAKISRVVQKLSERGLVEIERRGRTNLVRISRKRLET